MPAEDQTTEEQTASESAAVRPTRRRRAAGRPAGPPPEAAVPVPAAEPETVPAGSGESSAAAPAGQAAAAISPSEPAASVPADDAAVTPTAPSQPADDTAGPTPEAAPAKPARRAATRPRRASRAVSEAVVGSADPAAAADQAAGPAPASDPAATSASSTAAIDAGPTAGIGAGPTADAVPVAVAEKPTRTRRRAARSSGTAEAGTSKPPAGSDGGETTDAAAAAAASESSAVPEASAASKTSADTASADTASADAASADTTERGEVAPAVTKPRRSRARRTATKVEPVEPAQPSEPGAGGPSATSGGGSDVVAASDAEASAVAEPAAPVGAADTAGTEAPVSTDPTVSTGAPISAEAPAGESGPADESMAPAAADAVTASVVQPGPAAKAGSGEAGPDEVSAGGDTTAPPATAAADAFAAAGPQPATAGETAQRPARRRSRPVTPTWTSGAEVEIPAAAAKTPARRPVAMIMFQQPEVAALDEWTRRRGRSEPTSDEAPATGLGRAGDGGAIAAQDDSAPDDVAAEEATDLDELTATDAAPEDEPDAFEHDAFVSADTDLESDADETGLGGTRRRRRGRRGRGRARGEDEFGETSEDDGGEPDEQDREHAEAEEREVTPGRRRSRRTGTRGSYDGSGAADAEAEHGADEDADEDAAYTVEDGADDSADDGSDDDGSDDEQAGGSRRRRRRRRRSGVGEAAPMADDPPNTVVHVRETRKDDDLVRGVSGSTRLEAKRQRRREGRDSGRRRAPIVTEAEFLARRESVERRMVVRHHGDRTQIAVLEDGVLVEHFVTRASSTSYAGNVYLGRVQNVLASMEAAFVDIGKGRNAVLYAGEVNYDASGLDGRPRKIEQVLKSGQSVLVQVSKDPIGHKGARLTSQVSLPGRYLVYVPDGQNAGISRKLPDTERARLKSILKKITPENGGVIVRTAAEGASEAELERDVERLVAQWEDIQRKAQKASAPSLLYGEPDLVVRVIRDVFNEDFTELIVQGSTEAATVEEYVDTVAPDLRDRVRRYVGTGDVFAEYRVDEQLAKALDRKVWLPSGGSLVIDRTEAMTVIDVNTGKFTGKGGNLEETVTKNNLEAAEEIVRQLRLRDIGGIIVIDFIDMVLESNRELVLRRLTECLGRDRTRHQVAEVTSLGLVQMTRKRVGQGLLEAYSEPCAHCSGRGVTIHLDGAHAHAGPQQVPAPPAQASAPAGRRGRQAAKSGGPAMVAAAAGTAAVPASPDGHVETATPSAVPAAQPASPDGAHGAGAGGADQGSVPGHEAVRPEAAPTAEGLDELAAVGAASGPVVLTGSGERESTVFANTDDPDSVLHAAANGTSASQGAEKPARTRRRRASRPVSKPAESLQPSEAAGS
ncbi:ribonuclease [Frankia sp. R43]|nr:ribonuclease [Frankia sp. R43]